MLKSPWIRSKLWDSAFFLGIIPWGIIAYYSMIASPRISLILFPMMVWAPHAAAPLWLAWRQLKFRQLMLQNKRKFFWIPAAMLTSYTALGALAGKEFLRFTGGSGDLVNILMIMGGVYLLWTFYHGAAQMFGIFSIYRGKGKFKNLEGQRKFDYFFSFAMLCGVLPFSMYLARQSFVIGLPQLQRIFPASNLQSFENLKYFTLFLALLITSIALVREKNSKNEARVPRSILIVSTGVTSVIAFWSLSATIGMAFLSHWVAAVGIAIHTLSNHKSKSNEVMTGWNSPLGLYISMLLMSLPIGLAIVMTNSIETSSSGFVDITNLSVPIMTLFGFRMGVSNLHYIYDRYVFKFRDPAVRSSIGSDLVMNLEDFSKIDQGKSSNSAA